MCLTHVNVSVHVSCQFISNALNIPLVLVVGKANYKHIKVPCSIFSVGRRYTSTKCGLL